MDLANQQLDLLSILYERVPMGVAIFDQNLILQRCNANWTKFIEGYSFSPTHHVKEGMNFYDLVPDSESVLDPLFEGVISGQIIQREGLRLESQGVTFYWDFSLTPIMDHDNYRGFVLVMTDATDRELAQELLREREAQYLSIFQSTTDGLIIYETSGTVVEANPAAHNLFGYSYDEFLRLTLHDLTHPDHLHLILNALHALPATGYFVSRSISRKKDGSEIHTEAHGVPFSYRGQDHALVVVHDITAQVQSYQILEQRVEERTRELTTLLEISNRINATLQFPSLLEGILDELKKIIDYDSAAILLISEPEIVTLLIYRGPIKQEDLPTQWKLEEDKISQEIIRRRDAIIVPDVLAKTRLAIDLRELLGNFVEYMNCFIGVPLIVRDQVTGILAFNHNQSGYYTRRHAGLGQAFANQVAIAIENAHLYEQARELAALHERQRLARDLHDAVTQTLFSSSLIAEALPELWRQDQEEAFVRLDDLQRLTRGALAEMRSLLLELRPAGLTETPLSDLLRHLADAIRGRSRTKVELKIEGYGNIILAPDIQIAVYRITQEALNNAIKHAKATHINVQLYQSEGEIRLLVNDNGNGFSQDTLAADHMGLRIMRERAESIGAHLEISSQQAQGTTVQLEWKQGEI